MQKRSRFVSVVTLALLGASLFVVPASASHKRYERTYEVTIYNTSFGQPLSPPVVATHRRWRSLFRVGRPASDGIVDIAENGNPDTAVAALSGRRGVTDVESLMPIAPLSSAMPEVPTSRSVQVTARPGDRLSVAGMLICTNDGFAGVDRMRLPRRGTRTAILGTYDAGSEMNTQDSEDIVDPCSGLGPVELPGDPDMNNNDGIDTTEVITRHAGIEDGVGELSVDDHQWQLAAVLTVTRVR